MEITPNDYFYKSREGKWCAIACCKGKPTEICPMCEGRYCKKHIKIHYHAGRTYPKKEKDMIKTKGITIEVKELKKLLRKMKISGVPLEKPKPQIKTKKDFLKFQSRVFDIICGKKAPTSIDIISLVRECKFSPELQDRIFKRAIAILTQALKMKMKG